MKTETSTYKRLLRFFGAGFLVMMIVPTLIGMLLGGDQPAYAQDEPALEAPSDEVAPPEVVAPEVVAQPAGVENAAVEPVVGDTPVLADTPATDEAPAVDAPADEVTDGDAPAADAPAEEEASDGTNSLVMDTGMSVVSRLPSVLGIFVLLGIAVLLSNNRKRIDWRLVAIGIGLQWTFALFILKTPWGKPVFDVASGAFVKILSFTNAGSQFLFGSFVTGNIEVSFVNFTFGVLPTIIFFSSLMTVLYHLGIMQRIVSAVAVVVQTTMRTSGSETLSATANIFVGQTEAPLMIKPFVATMTKSELNAIMVGGFATAAGGVLAAYVAFLSPYFPDIAGHLMAASVMAAPAGLVMAKIIYPETEQSNTMGGIELKIESPDANVVDAAARGASEGLQLALNVAAMLLAFIALIAMANYILAIPSYLQHGMALKHMLLDLQANGAVLPDDLNQSCNMLLDHVSVAGEARGACMTDIAAAMPGVDAPSIWPVISLETILGYLFWPIAWIMGVPSSDCLLIGQLFGQKMVASEFVAYIQLSTFLNDPTVTLQPRSIIIATYALCGFANFASIAIQIGGIGGIAPMRRHDLATLGLKAMLGGTLAAFLTATTAGILV